VVEHSNINESGAAKHVTMNWDGTWFGVSLGIIVILAALIWNRCTRVNRDAADEPVITEEAELTSDRGPRPQEKIRQIGLIEKDEFEGFYLPIIGTVNRYLEIVTGQHVEQTYFDIVYKALRKRRSAIFEFGSSERDQKHKALWTFALFCAVSVRYVVTVCQDHEFKKQGEVVNPYLLTLKALGDCDVRRVDSNNVFEPGTSQIHLIDKLLDASVISQFEKAGMYPFIVNAVSGFYSERMNPFYGIIEQVEAFQRGTDTSEESLFMQNLECVLGLIENNTFSINTNHSLAFEGMTYLLVDRNFLWELYRGYAISEGQPLGKKDFEERLCKTLNIAKSINKDTVFTFTLDADKLDESQEKIQLELRNMVALPYKVVPYYRPRDKRKIKKHALQRDIVVGDIGKDSFEEQDGDSSIDKNKSRIRATHFPEGSPDSVGLKDLFSESP